jgi:Rod binding domain-containing protein
VSDIEFPGHSPLPLGGLAGLLQAQRAASGAAPEGPSAQQAAKDFESLLIHKVLEEMKRTIGESGLLEDGTSQQVQDIFWFYLAGELANQGGLGLWKEIYRQMDLLGGPGPARPTVETTS